EAEASFRKAVEAAPKSIEARLALANLYWATRRQTDAEATLKAALEIEPASIPANRALGVFYVATGRTADAEPYFRALARAVDTPAAQASLAQYYVIADRHDAARTVLNELLTRKDGVALATVRLAALDALENQRAHAEERLRLFLEKNPKEFTAQLLYADLLRRDFRRDEAAAAVSAAIALDTKSAAAHRLAGLIAAQSDRFEAAIEEYQKALAVDSRSYQSALELAALHLTLGHPDKS